MRTARAPERPCEAPSSILAVPAVSGGVVYARGNNFDLYAVNEATGKHKWAVQLTGGNGVSSPVVVGSAVYATAETSLFAINTSDGHILWGKPASTGGAQVFASPALGNCVVYVTSNVVIAYNATTGAKLWQDTSTLVESSGDGTLYAFNAMTGRALWQVAGDGGGVAVSAIANGVVYVSGFNVR